MGRIMEDNNKKIDAGLNSYLNGSLLVPLESDLEDRLAEVSIKYINEEKPDYEIFSDMVLGMLTGVISDHFKEFLSTTYEEDYSEKLAKLPIPVYLALQGYTVFNTIREVDDIDTKLIYAFIVINHLLLRHNTLDSCPYQPQIKECEEFVFEQLARRYINTELECESIYENIFDNTLSVTIDDISEDEQNAYKAFAAKSWLYDLNETISEESGSKGQDIEAALRIIEWIFDNIPSIEIKVPIVNIIKHCFSNQGEKRSLEYYIDKITVSGVELFEDDSFQLIPNVSKLELRYKKHISEIHLTQSEFICYLFFEILLDKLIEQNGI